MLVRLERLRNAAVDLAVPEAVHVLKAQAAPRGIELTFDIATLPLPPMDPVPAGRWLNAKRE